MDKLDEKMLEGLSTEQKVVILHAQVRAIERLAIVKIATETIMFLAAVFAVLLIFKVI